MAKRKRRSHLNTSGSGGERFFNLLRRPVFPRQPERQAKVADFLQIHLVTLSINRLAILIERHFASRRRIVATRARPFNHKAIHACRWLS